jgi:hypothetical protein
MHSKTLIGLAAMALVGEAVAVNVHRHGHQHMHKREVVTDIEVVTDYVTETVWIGGAPTTSTSTSSTKSKAFYTASHRRPSVASVATTSSTTTSSTSTSTSTSSSSTSTSTSTSTSVLPAPTTSSTSVVEQIAIQAAPTTLITSTKAPAETTPVAVPVPIVSISLPVAIVVPTTTTPAPVQTTAASAPATGGNKRGLAYNDKNLLSGFLGGNSKVSWKYGWSQSDDGGTEGIEFVPMLWGLGPNHEPTWKANAEKAIARGSAHFLSFNEPDNAGQANLSPSVAAQKHIELMAPYSGRVRISSPAITNSNIPGEGIDWLKSFLSACSGQCKLDFVPVHWYNQPNADEFLQHLVNVHEVANLPVWVTEFAPFGSDSQINDFLQTVMKELDTNPKYNFVERYAYFMVNAGSLISSGKSLSTIGKTFAFA